MYEINKCTVSLGHGTVHYLRIYGEGYVIGTEPFEGGYSKDYIEVYFLTAPSASSFKDVRIACWSDKGRIPIVEVEDTILIKSVFFKGRFYILTARFV